MEEWRTKFYGSLQEEISYQITFCLENYPKELLMNLLEFLEEKSLDEESRVHYDELFSDVVESIEESDCLELIKSSFNRRLKRGEV